MTVSRVEYSGLDPLRTTAFLALTVALGVYYGIADELDPISTWWTIALLAFAVIPAVFALVYLALPLRLARGLLAVVAACGIAAFVLELVDLGAPANFAKLAAMTFFGFWFLIWFERVSWLVLVALLVPLVDIFSVFRGPTKEIIENREEVFTALSFAFPVPGGGAARLGLPDLLFFALFLAAASRFELRVGWTWLAMTLSFGATMALATAYDVYGLPALPLLCLGFLAPNADLLWRRVREDRQGPTAPSRRLVRLVGMGRTNVVVDDELIERVMQLYGLRTKREAIDLALRRLVSPYTPGTC